MPPTFRIYSSSAGSGKTYQLTKEYLKLALGAEDAAYFKSILAITFTNDAAGEMKERIIGALRRFAYPNASGKEDTLLRDIANELAVEGKLPLRADTPQEQQQELRRRAAATFRLVLYHYADFAVSTIDSFVQRIVQAFTRELGLPAAFEVELDGEAVLQSAVALLLDKVNRDPNSKLLARSLADYALSKAEEGRSWNTLPEELVQFGQFLLSEPVHEAVAQLQQLSLQDYRRLHENLRKRREEIEQEFRAVSVRALAALDAAGVTEADLYQGKSGIIGYVTRWEERLLPDKEANSYVRATVEQDKWYSGKVKTAADKQRVDAAKPDLTAAYHELEDLRARLLPDYLLVLGMLPYIFHVSLLSELNKAVDQLSRERNVVLIAEFNRRIANIVLREPVPFLYERLGERYQHLLIDEFQDTSVLQWNNLLPLVENAVANGNLSLAVGDAKQAIYRWRGGEMEQILRLYKNETEHLYGRVADEELRDLLQGRYYTLDGALQAKNLNTNYRSASEIITFNNDFFGHISATHPQLPLVQSIYDEDFRQEAPQRLPASQSAENEGGEANVELLLTHDDAPHPTLPEQLLSYDESTLYLTLQLVEEALQQGFRQQDVAVLCRRRDQSRRVAKFLKERGYDIISADSLSLEFAEVVNLLVAVYRVLNQPADTLAKAEALLLVDKVVRGLAPTPVRARHIAEVANVPDALPFFDELRALGFDLQERETGNLGLYELTERLIGTFGLLGREGESEYLFRFLDLTLEFSLRHGNNLNNFLAYWQQKKSALSINAPAGRDAITITTVHKAKGLAYGVVIVPFADWSLTPHRNTLLWGRLPDEAKPMAEMPPVAVVPQVQALQRTALAGQYAEELEKTFLEGLNMLYVALTRPKHRLYLISRQPKKKASSKAEDPEIDLTESAKNVAELLHRYLVAQGEYDAEQLRYSLAANKLSVVDDELPAHTKQLPANRPVANTAQPSMGNWQLTNLSSTPWEERLRLRRHANTVFDFDAQQVQQEWNRKLHYALRRTLYAADVDRVAGQLVAEGLISSKERPELLEKLHQVVEHPQLAHYFSAAVQPETEREILVGGTRRQEYKPDRVVFDAAQPSHVTLLDFKTPPPEPRHRHQLARYADLFRQLGFTDVQCVLYYFDTQEIVTF
ncbi:UvrD-helicase domain-containing protein [Hymenobacter profundi]|uniref:DNA 3'-5' helicase n=1 Tax=Hymenobacter profundi TaxID=1982110 RepID=A0ABS6WYF3_9BACT|nr:UvrD-helicase domain-containing protein [Hymenobacter profundi]MBW3128622.1 UvrD-helicase domain-containing protein [Hymenobacter profundi]